MHSLDNQYSTNEFCTIQNQHLYWSIHNTHAKKLPFFRGTALHKHFKKCSYFFRLSRTQHRGITNFRSQTSCSLSSRILTSFLISRLTLFFANLVSVLESGARTRSKMTTWRLSFDKKYIMEFLRFSIGLFQKISSDLIRSSMSVRHYSIMKYLVSKFEVLQTADKDWNYKKNTKSFVCYYLILLNSLFIE